MRIHFIDISGSTSGDMRKAITANLRIGDRAVLFDTEIVKVAEIDKGTLASDFLNTTGGGTMFAPVAKHLAEIIGYHEQTLALVYSDMMFADFDHISKAISSLNGLLDVVFVRIGDETFDVALPQTATVRRIDAEPILFLAEIDLRVSEYMGDDEQGHRFTRLVRAASEAEAKYLIYEQFENPDQYGTSKRVAGINISAVIE